MLDPGEISLGAITNNGLGEPIYARPQLRQTGAERPEAAAIGKPPT